ncbi:MAG: hypothetical protein HWQ41_08165 [Nostoc sp. NOS(2021)]|uniref:hypothetical protein n=1 Tax=Nostoc sp. NOS(2021) TaxID=2815407 RepID=UPI0025F734D5|nr:hypothetical protein [Nostoc sp. NOS(2021)]MBN3895230.1 hypothetical protein [Nostoc sp. NOS(2021)]
MPGHQKSVLSNCNSVINYRIKELEAEVNYLNMVISTQAQVIAELQWQLNPYSQDSESLCNSSYEKGMD